MYVMLRASSPMLNLKTKTLHDAEGCFLEDAARHHHNRPNKATLLTSVRLEQLEAFSPCSPCEAPGHGPNSSSYSVPYK